MPSKPECLDFFAGSGLVCEGLKEHFTTVWANDICPKKAAVFRANHPNSPFHLGSIELVRGADVPSTPLSWGSFPCQDLSLAGNIEGISSTRSGLVWQWLRVMDEMRQPPLIAVAENVMGLVSAAEGAHYRRLHQALAERGYRVGAVVLDAVHWVPQSRKRVFVIAVQQDIDIAAFRIPDPSWCHPAALVRAAEFVDNWVWWHLPPPPLRNITLADVIDFSATVDTPAKRDRILSLIPTAHREKLAMATAAGQRVFPGYKRIRNGTQVLELRFDGIAGCLRTPEGGSSRQVLVLNYNGRYETRLLTISETAALMGAPASYFIPGSYNDAYKAMGDAVAVPVAKYLAEHLLAPLASIAREHCLNE